MTDPLTDEPSPVSTRRATRHQWGLRVLGVSLSALALAILISATALSATDLATGTLIADGAVLAAMATGVVVGFVYGAPRGILRFRSRDLLYGVVIGLALRLVQGLVAQAAQGGAAAWPTATLDLQWVVFGALVPVVVSPLLEELFFRGVLLLSADTVFRRLTGSRVLAGIAATLVSSALFVLAHGLTSTLDVSAIVSLGAVALVTSTIILVQRRLWTAIVVHAVFNVTFVILQLAGSLGTAGAPALS